MTVIQYRPAKMAMSALWCGMGAAALCLIALRVGAFPLAGAAILAFFALVNARMALTGKPALQFDGEGVRVSTPQRSASFRWDELRDIKIQSLTLRYMGVIPVSQQNFLIFVGKGGPLTQKNFKMVANNLELPAGGVVGLHDTLCRHLHAARTGTAPVAATGLAAGETPGGFDPDAAIARYLARKPVEDQAAVQAPTQGLAVPQRPVFGRRVAR